MIKVTRLKIKNIGLIQDTDIEVNKPLLLFYGDIRQGKSTILKAVRWACGGEFPEDIIRHGAAEAAVELHFTEDNKPGVILREWYRGKVGEKEVTKAREVVFTRNGLPVKRPATEIAKLLNPFLSNQNYLLNMNDDQRRQYFTTLFSESMTDLDQENFRLAGEAQALRKTIDAYGQIDLTPVERVDVEAIKAERKKVTDEWSAKVEAGRQSYRRELTKVQEQNRAISLANDKRTEQEKMLGAAESRIADFEKKLADMRKAKAELEQWLKENPRKDYLDEPKAPADVPEPDFGAFEERIEQGMQTNMRSEQYAQNQARARQKEGEAARLRAIELRQKAIKEEKAKRLRSVTDKCGIAGLAFDEEGEILFENTTAGMLSTSQIMRLSSMLSALYPKGLGLELIDRGESLGPSILEFVTRAKAEEKTILAAIVGESPAKVPEEVGVFVVQQGKVSRK